MAAQRDEDRHGREHIRALITGGGVLLACGALAALVLTDDPKELRLAIVASLWAFLLVAITGRFRRQELPQGPDGVDHELRHFYQLELQQEVAARKEYELRLEVQLRRELEENRTSELADLRSEVNRLRADLRGIDAAPERAIALLAQATRISPENLRNIQEEALRKHRPSEPLQLPASSTPAPAAASTPVSMSTEPIPASEMSHPSHPSHPSYSSYSAPQAPSPVAAQNATPEYLPVPRAAQPSEESSSSYGYARGQYGDQPSYTLPADSYASSDSYTPPPGIRSEPSWSAGSYSQPAPVEQNGNGNNHHAAASYGTGSAYNSYPEIAFPEPAPGAPGRANPDESIPWPEPFPSRGRHGALSVESSRADPFDPSNTWPDAFKAKRDDSMPAYAAQLPELPELPVAAPAPREAETYSYDAEPSRPAERPSRGRHHAEETGSYQSPSGPNHRRPDDDVLAQILGRW